MKITDVKLRFAKHYLFVQVYTDAGIVGLGEAGNWGYLQATAAAIEKFADYLIGKDPFRIEDFNQNFLRSVYFRGSVIMSAISAIDIALWDIKGKALGVPVYELLGGKTRDKVRVYASVMHITEDKNELAAQYQRLPADGASCWLKVLQRPTGILRTARASSFPAASSGKLKRCVSAGKRSALISISFWKFIAA